MTYWIRNSCKVFEYCDSNLRLFFIAPNTVNALLTIATAIVVHIFWLLEATAISIHLLFAIPRSYESMYKHDKKNEAKKIRATTSWGKLRNGQNCYRYI